MSAAAGRRPTYRPAPSPKGVRAPFVVVIDSREQDPWRFEGLRSDAGDGHAPLYVPAIVRGLDAGDYSIEGREREIRIERKSAADLFATLSFGRRRFERELGRLSGLPLSCVVVEAEFRDLVERPPSRMQVRSFVGSVVALTERYPTRWYFAGNRQYAEALAFRILERWHRDREAAVKDLKRRGVPEFEI